jgi:hypothetical protein
MANDGQGHHPSDANDVKHLDPKASTGNASKSPIKWMPPGGGYKRVADPRLFLSQLVDYKEASVKKQEEQEAGHTTHCEQ